MPYKTKELKLNPDNPRIIKDGAFEKLVESISKFPKMLEIRPIVIDETNMILAGEKRYMALKKLGYKEIPDEYVRKFDTLTQDEKEQFIIKDNTHYGAWDTEKLANGWNEENLVEWGVPVHSWKDAGTNDLLPTETTTVSFTASSKPSSSHADYANFEQLMKIKNKTALVDLLDEIKKAYGYELLEDALMHIVNYYKDNNPE